MAYLVDNSRADADEFDKFDESGTLSHYLFLLLAQFEEDLKQASQCLPPEHKEPELRISDNDAERQTAFSQEQRRDAISRRMSVTDQEDTGKARITGNQTKEEEQIIRRSSHHGIIRIRSRSRQRSRRSIHSQRKNSRSTSRSQILVQPRRARSQDRTRMCRGGSLERRKSKQEDVQTRYARNPSARGDRARVRERERRSYSKSVSGGHGRDDRRTTRSPIRTRIIAEPYPRRRRRSRSLSRRRRERPQSQHYNHDRSETQHRD